MEMQEGDLTLSLLFDAFPVVRRALMCLARAKAGKAQENRAPGTSPFLPMVVVMGCSHKFRETTLHVASFVLHLPDDTGPRLQSPPKDIAVSDLLPEIVPLRLRTERACAWRALKQLLLGELS